VAVSQTGPETTYLRSLGIQVPAQENGAGAPGPATSGARRSWKVLLVAGAALLGIISAFLPWASVLFFSVSGMQGDGRFVLVFGLAGLAGLALVGRPKAFCIVETVLGLAVAVVGIVDLTRLEQIIHGGSSDGFDLSGVASAGGGLYLAIFAGVAWAVAAALSWPRTRMQASSSTAPTAVVETAADGLMTEGADALASAPVPAAVPAAGWPAFCTGCGTRLGAGARFCAACGSAARGA